MTLSISVWWRFAIIPFMLAIALSAGCRNKLASSTFEEILKSSSEYQQARLRETTPLWQHTTRGLSADAYGACYNALVAEGYIQEARVPIHDQRWGGYASELNDTQIIPWFSAMVTEPWFTRSRQSFGTGLQITYTISTMQFGEVTGISQEGGTAVVKFTWRWSPTPLGNELIKADRTCARKYAPSQHEGTATLRLYDKGWRLENVEWGDGAVAAAVGPPITQARNAGMPADVTAPPGLSWPEAAGIVNEESRFVREEGKMWNMHYAAIIDAPIASVEEAVWKVEDSSRVVDGVESSELVEGSGNRKVIKMQVQAPKLDARFQHFTMGFTRYPAEHCIRFNTAGAQAQDVGGTYTFKASPDGKRTRLEYDALSRDNIQVFLPQDVVADISRERFVNLVRGINKMLEGAQSPASNLGKGSGSAIPNIVLGSVMSWGRQGAEHGEFNKPWGLALDRGGNIYVVDTGNNRIQKISSDGNVLIVWGSKGSEPGQFQDPTGITVAPDGSVYVADTWNHRIQQFRDDGTFVRAWREEDPPFWGPRGVAVAADGTVFITDTGNNRVLAYNAEGKRLRAWGAEGSLPGEFIRPVGIALTHAGEVVIADTGNKRLQFFSSEGRFLRAWTVDGWSQPLSTPGIALNGKDTYVTDPENNRILRYAGDGTLAGVLDSTGTAAGKMYQPNAIAAEGEGALYVADTQNHRILKCRL